VITIDKFCRVIASSFLPLFSFLAFIACPPAAPAQTVALPLSHLNSPNVDWAFADFDGDQKPDLAIAELQGRENSYRVRLRLSASGEASYFDVAPGKLSGLTITARDVDGDRDLDLIITAGIAKQPVGVWLNDGQGNFSQADSSLYPQSIWRAPPALFSRSVSSELPSARPEPSRSVDSECRAVVFHLPRAIPRRTALSLNPETPFFLGQSRVRPPPSL
jgi:hypothetical protein